MSLRNLHMKDSAFMLEWMKDENINQFFRFNKDDVTEDSVKKFIENSLTSTSNKHYAIIDKNDTYMGTISLKNIDFKNKNAEYAISLRKCSIGTGMARTATNEVLDIAFYELGLHRVYLNVLSENIRAIKFYEKYGFTYEGEFVECLYLNGKYQNLLWYSIIETNYKNLKK